jgi:hypothetical protein
MITIFSYLNSITMNRVLCLLIVVSFLGIGSCKKKTTDPDRCGTAWATQLSAEVNAMSVAAQAYATDPTLANCNAYKSAYQKYLDALEPFADCTGWTDQQKNELQAAIDEAQQEINSLCQ